MTTICHSDANERAPVVALRPGHQIGSIRFKGKYMTPTPANQVQAARAATMLRRLSIELKLMSESVIKGHPITVEDVEACTPVPGVISDLLSKIRNEIEKGQKP
jgi:hypothetical protein